MEEVDKEQESEERLILQELIDYIKEEQARPENINDSNSKLFDEID